LIREPSSLTSSVVGGMMRFTSWGLPRGSRVLREALALRAGARGPDQFIAMSMINIGVIGCGHWGPNHVRVFSQLRDSRVVAAADLDVRRLEAIGEQQPHVRMFQDFREMLKTADVEAVVIAAPTRVHYQLVKAAIEANKHVLCEKPLCLHSQEAAELVALAKIRRRVLMTGHVFLFNSGIVKLRELVSNGDPGRIYYLRALRTNLGPVRRDVNSVFDLATHDIAIFNWVLQSRPESVSAVGGHFLQQGIEDVAFISLRYPDNILGHIQVSWLDPKKLREIVVVGDKKMVIWDELAPAGPITIYDKTVVRQENYEDFGQFQLLAREGDITIPKVRLEEPLKVQNRFFLKCVADGHLPMNDGPFAVDVVKVLEAIEQSLKSGGGPATVPA
jgi:predicted dehydrogenase